MATRTTVKVSVTLEVTVSDLWSDTATLAQIEESAYDSAKSMLHTTLRNNSYLKCIAINGVSVTINSEDSSK